MKSWLSLVLVLGCGVAVAEEKAGGGAAVAAKDEEAAKEKTAGNTVVAKLDQIVFPEVEMDGVPLDEAWGYVQAGMMKYDPEENVHARGVTMMLTRGPNEEAGDGGNAGADAVAARKLAAGVTYRGKNVRFLDLLAEIARQGGLDVYLTKVGIVGVPEGVPPFPNPKAKEGEVWKVVRVKGADEVKVLLEKGIVPVVDFEDTSVAEAVDFLRVRAAELQHPEDGKKGSGLVVRQSRGAEDHAGDAGLQMTEAELEALPKLTLSMKDATLGAVLREVARQAKLDLYLTTSGVLARPAGTRAFATVREEEEKLVEVIYRYEAPGK